MWNIQKSLHINRLYGLYFTFWNYNLDVKPLLESDNAARYDVSYAGTSLVEYTLDSPASWWHRNDDGIIIETKKSLVSLKMHKPFL